MESFSLYNDRNPTALHLPVHTLSPEIDIQDHAFEDWHLPDGRPHTESQEFEYTLAGKRKNSQPTWPLLTLPLKRSIHAFAVNHLNNPEQKPFVPIPSFSSFNRISETVTLPVTQSVKGPQSPEETIEVCTTSTPTNLPLTEWDRNNDTAAFDGSKPLLSPIKFSPPSESKISDPARTESCRKDTEPSGYLFYPPRNPADQIPQLSDSLRIIPRRQLSYGEQFRTPKPKTLHKATGSGELRRKAGWETDDDDSSAWLAGTLQSSIRPYHSEPTRRKPRLWLDLAEGDSRIEKAHATTLTSSPTKPQLISIPRRRVLTTTTAPSSPFINHEQTIPNIFPATPPDTPASPQGLSTNSLEASKSEKQRLAFEKIRNRPTWLSTPPTLAIPAPDSAETLRCTPTSSTAKTRPDTPRPLQAPTPQLSELTTWILTELEHSVSAPELGKLQLNSPVIQQIRLSPAQRRVPRSPPPKIPLSRYSTYSPLSSNPPSLPFPTTTPQPKTFTPLPALQTIFPAAPPTLLDTLQATLHALRHVSSIYLPSPSPYTSPPPPSHSPHSQQTAPPQSQDVSYIPSKARAMLGLQPSNTSRPIRPALPSSWLKPQVLSWAKRVEGLEVGLGREVGRLVGKCVAGATQGDGEAEEALMRAVGEVIRLGEGVR